MAIWRTVKLPSPAVAGYFSVPVLFNNKSNKKRVKSVCSVNKICKLVGQPVRKFTPHSGLVSYLKPAAAPLLIFRKKVPVITWHVTEVHEVCKHFTGKKAKPEDCIKSIRLYCPNDNTKSIFIYPGVLSPVNFKPSA